MKKVITILMVSFLLLCSCGKAELIEQDMLSSFADEELKYLVAICQAEIKRRAGDDITLEPGQYWVGLDFPSDTYRVDMVSGFASMADFYVYADNENYMNQTPYIDMMLSLLGDQPSIGRVYLPMNSIVYVTGTVKLSIYTGLNP